MKAVWTPDSGWTDEGLEMNVATDGGRIRFVPVDGMVTVSLAIENTYENGDVVNTTATDVVVPAPPADEESEEYAEWGREHIFQFTGTGRPAGDSWYDVTITASSRPELIGRTYEFGY